MGKTMQSNKVRAQAPRCDWEIRACKDFGGACRDLPSLDKDGLAECLRGLQRVHKPVLG
jgi:hypothetical protein